MTDTLVGTPDPEEPSNVTQFPQTTVNSTYQYYPAAPTETTRETIEREYDDQGRVIKETRTSTTTRTQPQQPMKQPWYQTYPNTGSGTITFGAGGAAGRDATG